jgi:tRNA(fMet)-specific endonuclease VapC
MIYMLDTYACIRYLNNPASSVGLRFVEKRQDEIVISAVTEFEILFGALNADNPPRECQRAEEFLKRFECVAYDRRAAQIAAQLHHELCSKGQMIGPLDLQIAATAVLINAILVTHNVREFSRVPHLQCEDWEASL